jgi:hypothetical protein
MRATYDDVARRQLGLVTKTQLADRGWTRNQISRAQERKELLVVRRGVYRVQGAPVTREQVWLAAKLAAGDDHVIGGLTAAAAWGFRRYPDPDDIELLTDSATRSSMQGVRTHRTNSLPRSHVMTRNGLTLTTPARTLIDTCGGVDHGVLSAAANDLLRRRILTPRTLARTFEETPVSGRRASRPAKLLLARVVPGYHAGESDEELDVVDVLVRGGYPAPAQQIRVSGRGWRYRIDVGYPDIRHGFEFLGERDHRTREAFHNDQIRTLRLQAAGWTIWPVTSRTAKAEILLAAATAFGRSGAA